MKSNLLREEQRGSFHIFYFNELSTTQEKAKEFATKGREEWTIVVSATQTAGRGRFHTRNWFSPMGGLWFSVLLRPEINFDELKGFSLFPSISAAWSIQKLTGLNALIKWPNDIIVGKKKIAGTVIESKINMRKAIYSVVGIGINANFLEEAFPKHLNNKATSLLQKTGKEIRLDELLVMILQKMRTLYGMIIRGESFRIIEEYHKLSDTIGRKVKILSEESNITGKAKRVGENGALILELSDGSVKKIETCEYLIYT